MYEQLYKYTVRHLADLRAQDFTEGESDWQEKLETILDQLFAHLHPIIERSKPKIVESDDLTDALPGLLTEFLRVSKVKKKDFAEKYDCRPEHISRFLKKERNLNFISLVEVIHSFGYSVKVDTRTKKWEVWEAEG